MASLLDYTFHHFELVWIHACVVVLAADRRCSGGSSSSSSDKKTEIGANRKYLAGIIMGERVLVTAVAASVDRGGGAGISSKRCSTPLVKTRPNPGKGNWEQLIMECLDTYDTPENFRFFRRHSGLLGHDIAHVGNPDVCTAAGHSFFWGMLVFRLEQAPGYPPRDVGLEFSLCVPKSCSFSVVETIFVPYTLGRYLGLNWGPETPEVMSRWNVDKANTIPVEDMVNHFVHKIVAKHPKGPGGWYEQEWPYRQKLWQYQPSWWPGTGSCAVLAALAVPPLIAGMCLQLARWFGLGAQHDKAAPNGSRSSWLYGLRTFAPQRHIHDLWVARSGAEEMPQLHVLRLILQLLVCFQHTILLVDWLGGSGFSGIESFQPITSQVSKVLGRVNHTFACLSVVLSIRSMGGTLRAVRAAGGGLARSVLAATTWTMRRWLRQACHLAFWMLFGSSIFTSRERSPGSPSRTSL
ncbi:unnamed protein product [Symbiodinium sp. CCMP2456]|nr:unnamed protein product [Symbiodinium sp. CCMP2456]